MKQNNRFLSDHPFQTRSISDLASFRKEGSKIVQSLPPP
jgi:hypothetical protein